MDIDVPPDLTLHVNDLPPELLYAVFVLLCPPRTLFGAVGDKRDLCAVVLVCHHWRDVALAILFSDVSFGVAEFTDSTVWKGRLAREPLDKRRILNQEGREIAVHGLVTVHGFLKRKPFICHSIRRLTLHRALHHFPPWDISLVKTDLALGREILGMLPRLEELVISRMVILPPSAPAPQHSLPPQSLQRLLVDYGPAFAEGNHRDCEEHTARLIGCFTGLREITIDGYHGTTPPAPGAPALVFPPHLHRLEMRNVHARPALLADLRQSPAMATLQHLVWETDAAPPRAEQQGVQALLTTLGPRLLSFACSVAAEPPPAEASDAPRAPPLDLAPCLRLERLRLTVLLPAAGAAPRVWAHVARMLRPHGAPLRSVALVLRGPPDALIVDAPVEDALVALRRVGGGSFALDVTVPREMALACSIPKKMTEWFPRLVDCITLRY